MDQNSSYRLDTNYRRWASLSGNSFTKQFTAEDHEAFYADGKWRIEAAEQNLMAKRKGQEMPFPGLNNPQAQSQQAQSQQAQPPTATGAQPNMANPGQGLEVSNLPLSNKLLTRQDTDAGWRAGNAGVPYNVYGPQGNTRAAQANTSLMRATGDTRYGNIAYGGSRGRLAPTSGDTTPGGLKLNRGEMVGIERRTPTGTVTNVFQNGMVTDRPPEGTGYAGGPNGYVSTGFTNLKDATVRNREGSTLSTTSYNPMTASSNDEDYIRKAGYGEAVDRWRAQARPQSRPAPFGPELPERGTVSMGTPTPEIPVQTPSDTPSTRLTPFRFFGATGATAGEAIANFFKPKVLGTVEDRTRWQSGAR